MTTPNQPEGPAPHQTTPLTAQGNDTAPLDANQTGDGAPAEEDDNRTATFGPHSAGVGGGNETTDDLATHGRDTGGVAAAPPRKKPQSLPTVPGYEITGVLGRGGMGVVYRAHQTRLNRPVALKMVLAGAHASPEQLSRFDQEARAVARLQHPNIVQIYEIGELDGLPYFSLELVEGGTLEKHIDRKPQPPNEAAALVEALARAMGFAHRQHIIHRDLKPGNVLLAARPAAAEGEQRGGPPPQGGVLVRRKDAGSPPTSSSSSAAVVLVPKITDFGLAKTVDEGGTAQTASGAVMGTPAYMAPEQARGDLATVGPPSDQYALGAILYEMLTGRPPFQGASLLETLSQVQKTDPVPPRQLQPGVPADLDTVCLKCLNKEPGKRYASCEALADDLRRYLNGEAIVARPVSSGERVWRWCKRHPGIASLSAALAVLLVCVTAASSWAAFAFARQAAEIADEKGKVEELLGKEQAAREKEQAAREKAVAEEKLATGQARVALESMQAVLTTVQERLRNEPQTQELKRDLLNTVLGHVDRIDPRAEGATNIGPTRISAHAQLGLIYRERGESEKALAEFRKVYQLAKARVPMFNRSDASRRNLAVALNMLGQVYQELNRDMRSAMKHYQEALGLWEEIQREPRTDANGRGRVDPLLVLLARAEMSSAVGATHLRLGEAAKALPYFQKSLELRRQATSEVARLGPGKTKSIRSLLDTRLDLMRALLAVGDANFRLKLPSAASASLDEALKVVEGEAARYPRHLGAQQEWGRACAFCGDFYLRTGDLPRARGLYEAARARAAGLVQRDPRQVLFQWDLGHAEYRLGALALRSKDAAAAARHFHNCLAIRERLAAQDKANVRRQMEYMLALAHCGRADDAEVVAQRVLRGKPDAELLVDVARCYSQCSTRPAGVPPAAADLLLAPALPGPAGPWRLSLAAQRAGKVGGDPQRFREAAIAALRKALQLGYRDDVYLSVDVDLDPLRSEPAFQEVIEAARAAGDGTGAKQ